MNDSASTTPAPAAEHRLPVEFNTLQINADILEVLCEHGFSPRIEDVTVTPIVQGGHVAGVSITANVYERPAALGPPWTREQYDAWIGSAFEVEEVAADADADAPESERTQPDATAQAEVIA